MTSVLKVTFSISSHRYEALTGSLRENNKRPCGLDTSGEDKTESTNIRHLQSENLQMSYQRKSHRFVLRVCAYKLQPSFSLMRTKTQNQKFWQSLHGSLTKPFSFVVEFGLTSSFTHPTSTRVNIYGENWLWMLGSWPWLNSRPMCLNKQCRWSLTPQVKHMSRIIWGQMKLTWCNLLWKAPSVCCV